METNERICYRVPTRPYSIIDAVNRMWAATGSVRTAMATTYANYNGHHVTVAFNTYRQYWTAEYFWGERVVVGRGSLEECLDAALREHSRGALGSSVAAYPRTEDEVALCVAKGLVTEAEAAALRAEWHDARYDEVNEALNWERHGMAPATAFLTQSKDVAEYKAKLEAHFAERRPRRNA